MLESSVKEVPFETTAIWEKKKQGNFKTTHLKENTPFSCPPVFGGTEEPSPEDLFLVSIASCTLTTILHICDSLRSEPEKLKVTTRANMVFNKSEGFYEFSKIKCLIEAQGEEFLLKRACELAPKYCLVGKSVRPDIIYEYNIIPQTIID
jgi:uncharacterized OsmC-like protein